MRQAKPTGSTQTKFLIDECVRADHDFVSRDFIQSVDAVGMSAGDPEVFDYAVKEKLTLITRDKRFALKSAFTIPVIYKRGYAAFELTLTYRPELSGLITYHLNQNDDIVRP